MIDLQPLVSVMNGVEVKHNGLVAVQLQLFYSVTTPSVASM